MKIKAKAPKETKRYRIKEGAPDHFFGHTGILKAGQCVDYAGVPGKWLELVDESKADGECE